LKPFTPWETENANPEKDAAFSAGGPVAKKPERKKGRPSMKKKGAGSIKEVQKISNFLKILRTVKECGCTSEEIPM